MGARKRELIQAKANGERKGGKPSSVRGEGVRIGPRYTLHNPPLAHVLGDLIPPFRVREPDGWDSLREELGQPTPLQAMKRELLAELLEQDRDEEMRNPLGLQFAPDGRGYYTRGLARLRDWGTEEVPFPPVRCCRVACLLEIDTTTTPHVRIQNDNGNFPAGRIYCVQCAAKILVPNKLYDSIKLEYKIVLPPAVDADTGETIRQSVESRFES